MTPPALGAVVVGTGFGCITHVRALRAAGFDVLGLIGRDAARTAERAAAFEVPRAFTSFDEALAVPGVDAVTIATPPGTHAELTLAAIAAGRHVICEKPFTRDAAEARTVLAGAEAAGVVHVLGTEFRWDPGQATLAAAVRNGLVGEPRIVTVVLHVPSLADADAGVPAWWADADAGGGWLGAHGSQVIDQLRVTVGDLAGVSASVVHVVDRPMTADDGFVVHFRTRSGAAGTMQSTAADRGPMLIETRVTGSLGTAWIDGLGATVQLADRDGTRALPVAEHLLAGRPPPLPDGVLRTTYDRMIAHGLDLAPYTRLAEAFARRIRGRPDGDGPVPATFADGVAAMEVLDAIRASAPTGAWVPIGGQSPGDTM